jgi:hypothetical protein
MNLGDTVVSIARDVNGPWIRKSIHGQKTWVQSYRIPKKWRRKERKRELPAPEV